MIIKKRNILHRWFKNDQLISEENILFPFKGHSIEVSGVDDPKLYPPLRAGQVIDKMKITKVEITGYNSIDVHLADL